MKKILVGIIILSVVAALFFFNKIDNGKSPSKSLAIINFIDHPVLNIIEQETVKGIRTKFSENELNIQTSTAQGRIEDIPQLARTIKRTNPYLILTISTPVSSGVMEQLDSKMPIVYTFVTDPSDLGENLKRTNNTGLSDAVNYGGNIKLIERVIGPTAKIGFAYNPNEPNSISGLNALENILNGSKMQLIKTSVLSESDVPQAINSLANRVDVIYVGGDNTTVGAFTTISRIAKDKGVPVIASDSGSIRSGAIAGYSVDYKAFGERTASVVIKILEGQKPRDIPRITIPGDKLIVNLQAAKAINFKIAKSIVSMADEVIE